MIAAKKESSGPTSSRWWNFYNFFFQLFIVFAYHFHSFYLKWFLLFLDHWENITCNSYNHNNSNNTAYCELYCLRATNFRYVSVNFCFITFFICFHSTFCSFIFLLNLLWVFKWISIILWSKFIITLSKKMKKLQTSK